MSTGLAESLKLLTDAELERMAKRAWYAAARAWSEYRSNADPELSNMLNESAWSDENYWRALYDEQKRRAAEHGQNGDAE